MEFHEVPSNSYSRQLARTETTDVPKNVEGPPKEMLAKRTKPTFKGKILSHFLPEDFHDLKSYWMVQKDYIIDSIIVPNIKRVLAESINSILGTNITVKSPSSQSRIDRTSVYDYSLGPSSSKRQTGLGDSKRKVCFYENLIFDTKEAADFHKKLITEEFNNRQGSLSVLDFMEKAGQNTIPTQADWGWTSLNGYRCEYSAVEDGWVVSMPWPSDEVRQ